MNPEQLARAALQGFFGTGKEGFKSMSASARKHSVSSVNECLESDLGTQITTCARLGHTVVSLREQIPFLEKLSKRTPPKHLKKEWDKVHEAKKQLDSALSTLAEVEPKWQELKKKLGRQ